MNDNLCEGRHGAPCVSDFCHAQLGGRARMLCPRAAAALYACRIMRRTQRCVHRRSVLPLRWQRMGIVPLISGVALCITVAVVDLLLAVKPTPSVAVCACLCVFLVVFLSACLRVGLCV